MSEIWAGDYLNILLTGGAGYIGSHTIIELLNSGHNVIVADNLCNSSQELIRRVEQITGQHVAFFKTDIRDRDGLNAILDEHPADACIHFAGLKAVGESVALPLE